MGCCMTDVSSQSFLMSYKTLTHQQIIDLVLSLTMRALSSGECNGFISTWLQEAVSGEQNEEAFYAILDNTAFQLKNKTAQELKEEIDTIFSLRQTQGFKNVPFTNEEQKKLDIRSLIETISVQQNPKEVFGEPFQQQDKEKLYALMSPSQFENRNPVYTKSAGIVALTLTEMVQYFISLKQIITRFNNSHRIGFLLDSDNHTTGMYFNQEKNNWRYMEINKLEGRKHYYFDVNEQELSELIFQSMSIPIKGKYAVFNLRVVASIPCDNIVKNAKLLAHKFFSQEDRRNGNGINILWLAIIYHNFPEIKFFIENTPKSAAKYMLPGGDTLLNTAMQSYDIDLLRLLLENGAEKLVNIPRPGDGVTLLALACSYGGYFDIAKLLLQYGAAQSINVPEKIKGCTPLFFACCGQNLPLIQLLLENGAAHSIKLPNKAGVTPKIQALSLGRTDIFTLLIEYERRLEIEQQKQPVIFSGELSTEPHTLKRKAENDLEEEQKSPKKVKTNFLDGEQSGSESVEFDEVSSEEESLCRIM